MILKFISAITYHNLAAMSPTTKNLFYFYQEQEVNLQLYFGPYCWLVLVLVLGTVSCRRIFDVISRVRLGLYWRLRNVPIGIKNLIGIKCLPWLAFIPISYWVQLHIPTVIVPGIVPNYRGHLFANVERCRRELYYCSIFQYKFNRVVARRNRSPSINRLRLSQC
jgi:hypothetical protein